MSNSELHRILLRGGAQRWRSMMLTRQNLKTILSAVNGAQNILGLRMPNYIGEQRETRKQIPMPELWL